MESERDGARPDTRAARKGPHRTPAVKFYSHDESGFVEVAWRLYPCAFYTHVRFMAIPLLIKIRCPFGVVFMAVPSTVQRKTD